MLVDAEIQRLVQTATRTFYEPKFVILIDQLVRKEAMKDEELAARVGTKEKDLAKIAVKLAEDGFLATHRRPELRPGAMKATAKTWYYIDFQRTIDVIKWRMYKIRKVIDDKLRNEIDSQGYVCPRCHKRFSTLDAGSLIDFASGVMRCDTCGTEVVDNENVYEVKRSKDQMNRLLEQTKPIVDGLRKAETIPLQAFNIAAWLEKHHPIAAADLLQMATSSAPQVVTVELDEGGDEEKRVKKEAEADAKRQQNLLPSWIERSTITGELTAAGAAQEGHRPSSMTSSAVDMVDGVPSPTKASQANDVDDFYASLAAAQAATAAAAASRSAAATAESHKSPSTQANSPLSATSKPIDSGYDTFSRSQSPNTTNNALSPRASFTETDARPSTSQSHRRMPSLRPPSAASVVNSLGKRSRAASEDDSETEFEDKKQRLKADNSLHAVQPRDAVASVEDSADPAAEANAVEEVNGEEGASEHDPMLQVAGQPKRFSDITEADTADMTPDEYQAYWEAMTTL